MAKSTTILREIVHRIHTADLRAMDDLATNTDPDPDKATRRRACQNQVRSLVKRLIRHNVAQLEILNDLNS